MPTIEELRNMYNMHELYNKHDDGICKCGRIAMSKEIWINKKEFLGKLPRSIYRFLRDNFINIDELAIEYLVSINENWFKVNAFIGIMKYGTEKERAMAFDVAKNKHQEIFKSTYSQDWGKAGKNVLLFLLDKEFPNKEMIAAKIASTHLKHINENKIDIIYKINNTSESWPTNGLSQLLVDGLDFSKIKVRKLSHYITLNEKDPKILEKKLKLAYEFIKNNPTLNIRYLDIIIPFNFDVVAKNKMHYIGYRSNRALYIKLLTQMYPISNMNMLEFMEKNAYSPLDIQYANQIYELMRYKEGQWT